MACFCACFDAVSAVADALASPTACATACAETSMTPSLVRNGFGNVGRIRPFVQCRMLQRERSRSLAARRVPSPVIAPSSTAVACAVTEICAFRRVYQSNRSVTAWTGSVHTAANAMASASPLAVALALASTDRTLVRDYLSRMLPAHRDRRLIAQTPSAKALAKRMYPERRPLRLLRAHGLDNGRNLALGCVDELVGGEPRCCGICFIGTAVASATAECPR